MSDPNRPPTLAGAQTGRVRPVRLIEGGVWFTNDEGDLRCQPAALRIVSQKVILRCEDLARQFLRQRGDQMVTPMVWSGLSSLFMMHQALIHPPVPGSQAPFAPLHPLPPGIADHDSGKIDMKIAAVLPLWDLADGQIQMLRDEYSLLLATETPPAISHEKWEAIVAAAGKSSLKTLLSQHGSSALIQVLHGTDDEVWRQ
jgi:hypothetical protein